MSWGGAFALGAVLESPHEIIQCYSRDPGLYNYRSPCSYPERSMPSRTQDCADHQGRERQSCRRKWRSRVGGAAAYTNVGIVGLLSCAPLVASIGGLGVLSAPAACSRTCSCASAVP